MARPKHAKASILVDDDEPGPQGVIRFMLSPLFTVYTAANGRMALTILEQQRIDLITLDERLPDRSGLALLREIKRRFPEIAVVMVTGYGTVGSATEASQLGAAGYLLKPFNVADLLGLVTDCIEEQIRRRAS